MICQFRDFSLELGMLLEDPPAGLEAGPPVFVATAEVAVALRRLVERGPEGREPLIAEPLVV
jgi:hypothetical protein